MPFFCLHMVYMAACFDLAFLGVLVVVGPGCQVIYLGYAGRVQALPVTYSRQGLIYIVMLRALQCKATQLILDALVVCDISSE